MLFTIGVIVLLGGVGLALLVRAAMPREAHIRGVARVVTWLIGGVSALVGLAAILFSMIVIIDPGYVGVQILFGHALPEVLHEGFHIVNPFVQVVRMDIRTQEYTMSAVVEEGAVKRSDAIDALTKDGLTVTLDVTVWHRLDPEKAVEVYRTLGPDYVNKIVRPAIRTALRDAATHFNAVDIYSEGRQAFVEMAWGEMRDALESRGIVVERVLLRNVALPPRVRDAIEEKLAAEQEAQRMEFVLEKERKEAERKRIEAQGLADAQRIINQTLTLQYLQYLYLTSLQKMAESNNTTFLIAPYDKRFLPLVNIR